MKKNEARNMKQPVFTLLLNQEKYNELRKDSKIKYLTDISKGTYVRLLVTVENIKNIQTKKGQPMSFC